VPAWLVFLVSGGAVAAAGTRLAKYGYTIAEGTGLGGMWVGAILVAAATSLPELLTDTHAVLQGLPSLAVGDLFGSCMANMMVLAVADLATRSPRMLTRVAVNQALVGTLGIVLMVVATIGLLAGGSPAIFGIGWPPLVVGFAYVAGMRLLHRNREEPAFRTPAEVERVRPSRAAVRRALIGFAIAALVIVVAAPYLARSTAELGRQIGISEGFAGLLLLAFTTSLPEIAVSYASVRAGAYSLTVGNLLGSNCFNMAALLPLDLVHGPGSLLAEVHAGLVVGALFGMLLMALALLDILNKSERRFWVIEPGPAFMVVAYLAGVYLTYRLTS
jgi:cation:H+ antiporter